MRCRTESAPVHLWQAEVGVVAGDDDVGVADEADAPADAESVDGGDDRYGTVVDGCERGEAALVRADERIEPGRVLHLFDVDAGVETLALRAEHDDTGVRILPRRGDRSCQVEPAGNGQRVDRRAIDDDLGNAILIDNRGNPHTTTLVVI